MAQEIDTFPTIHTKVQQPRLPGLPGPPAQPAELAAHRRGQGTVSHVRPSRFWQDHVSGPMAGRVSPRCVWPLLDEHDNDLDLFLRYLIGVVRTVLTNVREGTLELRSAPQAPPLRVLTTSLANDMDNKG
jgi:hypothetical protein